MPAASSGIGELGPARTTTVTPHLAARLWLVDCPWSGNHVCLIKLVQHGQKGMPLHLWGLGTAAEANGPEENSPSTIETLLKTDES